MSECDKCGEVKAGGKLYPIYGEFPVKDKFRNVLYVCWDCYIQHHREKIKVKTDV